MRNSAKPIAAVATLVAAGWLGGATAVIAAAADVPIYKPPAASTDDLIYKPPSRGAPANLVGTGTRGVIVSRQVWALAPDHTGLTTREAPTLYWFVDKPVATRIGLAAAGSEGLKPIFEQSLASPAAAGVQKIDLVRYGIRLQPGVEYRWTVTIEGDPRQHSSSAAIERVAAGPDLAQRLEATPSAGRAAVYAARGIWYDAIGSISELIEAAPNDAALRRQRAALLLQAGLHEAAAGDQSTH